MKTILYPFAMSAFLCLQAQTLGATHSVEFLRDPWGIPHVVAEAEVAQVGETEVEPLPGRKPDDPTLEAALRVLLRQGTPPEEADVQLARCRDYVRGNASLTEQLRSATVLGVYLIEESAAGRIKLLYGSPHVLEGLRALLKELGESESSDRRRFRGVQPEEASQPRSLRAAGQPEVWLCAGERIADLLRPAAEWSFVKQHLSGFKLYVDQINTAPPEQLAALVSLAKEHHYRIAIELGGCLDFAPMDDTAGEWSARHELAKIEKWYAAGGQVDFLDLDGPIRRLMHPENRQDGLHFDSIERSVDELVDALRLHRQAHPKTRFWLLTNFPNWGYQGDVSYHARGPQRQDYGDYDAVIGVVLRKLRAAEIPLAGVTVDNPYGYLMGEHPSVNLRDPKSVNWLKRVRSYEDFAREQGLEFNLIVNSERGGNESDERFHRETLAMVDIYRGADGRPTRWFVQSWYPYPKQIVPETAPHSMAALVKAVIERVNSGEAMPARSPAPLDARAARQGRQNDLGNSGSRIVLQPQPGAMQVTARVPALDNQAFALGIPETIGCREAMLVNFPEAKIEWRGPDRQGVVSCSWGPGGRISYTLRLIPAEDYVDVELTIRNHTEFLWHDVFAFNCLNPILAPVFRDWKLERTYMSAQGKPLCMAKTTRVKGHMPTVAFYLPERIKAGEESVFVRGFGATSPDRTDGSWIVTLSEAKSAFMAATAFEAAFLFDNLDRCCLHAAPSFGDIGPGESSTTVSRVYLAQGTLDDFLKRQEVDSPGLAARQKWARGARSAAQPPDSPESALAGGAKATDETRPRRRMADTLNKPSFEQYLRKAALSREVIDRFLRGPSWAQFDTELGYILGNYLPADGMDGSATLSTPSDPQWIDFRGYLPDAP